jgi:hypothetical protein
MGRLEELEEENARLLNNRRNEDNAKWDKLFNKVDAISVNCGACGRQIGINTTRLDKIERTVDGHDSSQGLKGVVVSLQTKMGFIQWLTAAIVCAVLAAAAERIFNPPATRENLESASRDAIEKAADIAAVRAAKVIASAKAAENVK